MLRNIKKKMYITYLKKHVASRWLRHSPRKVERFDPWLKCYFSQQIL